MTTANDTQVGGTHYKTGYQHWDLAANLGLGYFEGQITKYITRHRYKKGLEDAQKARHFTVKLIELARSGRYMPGPGLMDRAFAWLIEPQLRRPPVLLGLAAYAESNNLTFIETAIISQACLWRSLEDLTELLNDVDQLLLEAYAYSPAS